MTAQVRTRLVPYVWDQDAIELAQKLSKSSLFRADASESRFDTNSESQRETQCIEIENEFVRFSFLPEFGGRIFQVLNKESGAISGLNADTRIELERHSILEFGNLQSPEFGWEQCTFAILDPQNEDEPAEIQLRWMDRKANVSSQITAQLSSYSKCLLLCFSVCNRGLSGAEFSPGVRIRGCDTFRVSNENVFTSIVGEPDSVSMRFEPETFAIAERTGACLELHRFWKSNVLGPAVQDSLTVQIGLAPGVGGICHWDDSLAIGMDESSLTIVSEQSVSQAKITLDVGSGEKFVGTTNLEAGQVNRSSLTSLGTVSALAIESEAVSRSFDFRTNPPRDLLDGESHTWDHCSQSSAWCGSVALHKAVDELRLGNDPQRWVLQALRHRGDRADANFCAAVHSVKVGNWELALFRIDEALAYEAQNGVLWWLRSVVGRHLASDNPDAPDRLNAHFLMPLEPLLRAETFLGQPISTSGEGSPLLRNLLTQPRLAADVLASYGELALRRDAVRLAEEFCRIKDSAWFRLVLAENYLSLSRQQMEASTQLIAAGRLGFGPPLPLIESEFAIVDRLALSNLMPEVLAPWVDWVAELRTAN